MDCGRERQEVLAVASDGDAVTSFFEQARGQALIYPVIFRNEIREPLARLRSALHRETCNP